MNTHRNSSGSIDNIPVELRVRIMIYLKLGSLANMRLISRAWFDVFTNYQDTIHPVRRRLLALFDATVRSDVFRERRDDIKPWLDDFDRETFLSQLCNNGETLPEEFEVWVREWPLSAAMPESWPGTNNFRLPDQVTWWNGGRNTLRTHNNHLAAVPSALYIDSGHPVLQHPWQQPVPNHPVAKTNYRLRATTVQIWEPEIDSGRGHSRLCLRGEGPLPGCVIVCSRILPLVDTEGRDQFCTGHDSRSLGERGGERIYFSDWIDYQSYFLDALEGRYRHRGRWNYLQPPWMGIPPLCSFSALSPWQLWNTGYVTALGSFLQGSTFNLFRPIYRDTASGSWFHP